jgi:hypothetical protein
MAELAIPLVALGGMYVISNFNKDNKVKEGYSNNLQVKPIPVNYPITKQTTDANVRKYSNSNQITDRYFGKDVVQHVEQNNPTDSVGGSTQQVLGLTGVPIDKSSFKHNNMVPFFGAKIRGATANSNTSESTLDNMQGAGSQYIRKAEQAPLFKPQAHLQYANGAPNVTDFMLSRQNPSMRMANIKPWDEERVAPGLGLGYTTTSSGSGYNAAVESRNAWLPKTVNQLRVDTNPKMTYELGGHEGHATSYIKDSANVQTQGRIEKYRPDTDYVVGQNRWFTTTGLEKAQTSRGIEVFPQVSRPETTTEYYGVRAKEGKATYVSGEYREAHKVQLDGPDYAAPGATGMAAPAKGDYGIGGYNNLCNNRATINQPDTFGGIQGMVKAAVAPLLDVLRPSRKENVVGNLRPNGNASTTVSQLPIYNPADRTKTTIKEQTGHLLDNNHLNLQNQRADAYAVSKQTPVLQERDSTNVSYSGTAAPVGSMASMTYDAVYEQRNNVNKTYPNRPNHGTTQTFNNYQSINVARRDEDRVNSRSYAPSARINAIPSSDTYGSIKVPQYYDECIQCDRINPDILTAFKNNPYTQSLNSYA